MRAAHPARLQVALELHYWEQLRAVAMLFVQRDGMQPKIVPFEVGNEWRPVAIDLEALDRLHDVTGIFIGASGEAGRTPGGPFELFVDDVRLDP